MQCNGELCLAVAPRAAKNSNGRGDDCASLKGVCSQQYIRFHFLMTDETPIAQLLFLWSSICFLPDNLVPFSQLNFSTFDTAHLRECSNMGLWVYAGYGVFIPNLISNRISRLPRSLVTLSHKELNIGISRPITYVRGSKVEKCAHLYLRNRRSYS